MRLQTTFTLALLLFTGASGSAIAGTFSISPTRVELASGQHTAVVTLRNVDAAPLTVQAQVVDWTQPEGVDSHAETREVLVTPPVFTIPPGGEQIVRLALRVPPDPEREKAYRVFFQEIPQAGAGGANTLNFALRVGVPIFVAPPVKAGGLLQWNLHRQDDGKLRVEAVNNGNAHVQVTGFELSLPGVSERVHVEGMKYVLPGSRVGWLVEPPPGLASMPANAWVVGNSDQGAFDAEAGVAPRL
jgi:fimbrial chaperone protein